MGPHGAAGGGQGVVQHPVPVRLVRDAAALELQAEGAKHSTVRLTSCRAAVEKKLCCVCYCFEPGRPLSADEETRV